MAGETIGFVGLGNMGSLMAARLLEAGHQLVVFDVNPRAAAALVDRGAANAAGPREVGDKADIVLASLPSPAIVHEVAAGSDGLASGARIKTFIDLSTTGPRVAELVAEALAARGVTAIDAPVSGGVGGARTGKLTIMVSGPRAAYDAHDPLLKTLGRTFFIGEKRGAAQTMKLANNLIAATTLAVTCEAVTLGEKAGLDPKVMVEILNVSSGRSSASDDKFPRAILPRTFDFGFQTGLSWKDVRLCLEEANAFGVPMVVGSAASQMLAMTAARYGLDSDFTMMMKVTEHLAGMDNG
jgi:3-hydroxyisobutyrate dehydrogenase-like beta-hydroxyacid dehydrogenase